MAVKYNQYIYKGDAWRLVGRSADELTYSLTRVGDNIILQDSTGASAGTVTALASVPIASSTTLGLVRVGTGLTIDSETGVLNATGTELTIDSSMSSSSTNPVQNKAIKTYIDNAINGLGAAASKGVTDNSSSTLVTNVDTNLITGRTLYFHLAKAGYTTNTGTITGVTGGTGLSGSATSGSVTINHSNSVTAQNTQALYPIKIDAQGHISGYGSAITSLPASDVSDWAKASTKPTYTASEVGAVASSAVGAANGVAPLNSSTKIDASYLPSYVDDVIEGYYYNNKFYSNSTHTTLITGETGKIYVDLSSNKTYRYSGSSYTEISQSLAKPSTSTVYSMTSEGSVSNGTANTPTVIDTSKFSGGSFTRGTFNGGSFTQGTDSFTANTPTVIDTSKFSGGSYSHTGFSGGSFTRGTFSGGSLTFTMDSTDEKKLKISFTAATHGADTFTAASYGTDSFTAAKLNSGFYTAGTAASFTQGTDSFTAATHGADTFTAAKLNSGFYTAGTASTPTTVTLPGRIAVTGVWHD